MPLIFLLLLYTVRPRKTVRGGFASARREKGRARFPSDAPSRGGGFAFARREKGRARFPSDAPSLGGGFAFTRRGKGRARQFGRKIRSVFPHGGGTRGRDGRAFSEKRAKNRFFHEKNQDIGAKNSPKDLKNGKGLCYNILRHNSRNNRIVRLFGRRPKKGRQFHENPGNQRRKLLPEISAV